MKFVCAVVLLALQLGCTATCIRDSDCIGDSICFEDRCLLVRRDDGGTTAPAQGGAGGSGSAMAGDAGNTQGQGGVGGTTTDPRLNFDAATDAAPFDDAE